MTPEEIARKDQERAGFRDTLNVLIRETAADDKFTVDVCIYCTGAAIPHEQLVSLFGIALHRLAQQHRLKLCQ